MHGAALAKKAVLDIGNARDHLVAGAFVLCQLGDEGKYLLGVGANGRTDGEAHGTASLI